MKICGSIDNRSEKHVESHGVVITDRRNYNHIQMLAIQ